MLKNLLCLAASALIPGFAFAEDAKEVTPPSTITMHMNSMHPRDVVAEFTKQTGVPLQFWPEQMYDQNHGNSLPVSINVDADQESFWTVLDKICTAAKLCPQQMGQQQPICLQQSGDRTPFGKRPQFVGPRATITADSLQRNHSIGLDSDNPQVSKSCGVQLSAFVDPRVRVIKYRGNASLEKCEDESGQYVAADVHGDNWQDAYNPWQFAVNVPLDYDAQVSHKLSILKGSVHVMAAAEIEKIEFEDLSAAQGTEKEAAGIKVTCNEVKETDNSIEVKITILREDMPKEKFRELYGRIYREGKFFTAEGKQMNFGGGGGGGEDKLDYSLSTSWGGNTNDKPVRLLWELVSRTEEIDLPFEFKDLTLP
jgi:hypothetical protein